MKAEPVLDCTFSGVLLILHRIVHPMELMIVLGLFFRCYISQIELTLLMLTFAEHWNSSCNSGMGKTTKLNATNNWRGLPQNQVDFRWTDRNAIQNANFHGTCNVTLNRSNDDKKSKLIEIVGKFK